MKRSSGLLFAAIFLLTVLLAACSSPQKGAGTSGSSQYVVKIMMVGDSKTEDCNAVAEAASKILQPKLNTTVELTRLGFGTYTQEVNLMLASGEKLDLIYDGRDIFVSAVNSGQIIGLDDYLPSYAPEMYAQISPGRWASVSVSGKIYGMPVNKETAVSWGFTFNKAMADATGYDYTKIKTDDDLAPLFAAVKAKFPDVWPVVSTASNTGMWTLTSEDPLGGDFGWLENALDPNTTKVVNFYATNTYRELVTRRYNWMKRGFIPPDTFASTEGEASMVSAGKAFGYYSNVKPGIKGELEKKTNLEMVVLEMTPVYTYTTRNDVLWYVAHNSKEPGRAVQVLNEMYINPDLANIFINGIEGRHYEFKNKAKGIIGYPAGVDGSNVGYPSYPWAWPNEMISYVWEGDPEDIWSATSAWNKSAIESPAMGFTWDNNNVLNEVTACVNVSGKYEHALRAGALDPAVALPAFLKELNDAGITAIIAEKQRQLDAWLASKK